MRERTVLKIGEFARVNQVSIATLRHYDQCGDDLFLGQAYAALYRWMKDSGYRVIGPPRQVRLRHGEHMDPNQYITEVQFPVEKQRV